MLRNFALLIFATGYTLLCGCNPGRSGTARQVEVPGGGEPVLKTEEQQARGTTLKSREPALLAPVSYEQAVEVPPIIKPFEQWTDQDAAEDALGRIGSAAVPALVQALQSPDPQVRRKGIEVLGRMGREAADAVPALVPLLDDPDPTIRKTTARTLGQIGPAAKDAVPALMRTLLQPAESNRAAVLP